MMGGDIRVVLDRIRGVSRVLGVTHEDVSMAATLSTFSNPIPFLPFSSSPPPEPYQHNQPPTNSNNNSSMDNGMIPQNIQNEEEEEIEEIEGGGDDSPPLLPCLQVSSVRSGHQVYAQNRGLVVLGSVNDSAEV